MFLDTAKQLQVPGAIAVIPTDTVYGVVARAADVEAVQRLYQLKRRQQKPGTIIAANIDQLVELGIKRRYLTAVEQFWPGAVSVIIPTADPALAYLHLHAMSLAVRIPEDRDLSKFLLTTGPLLTTSANHPGEPPATTLKQAKAYFGASVDFYVDGGDLADRQASTIIRVVDDAVEVIRQGAVRVGNN